MKKEECFVIFFYTMRISLYGSGFITSLEEGHVKKVFVFGVIMLVLCPSVPVFASATLKTVKPLGNILYVGGSGEGNYSSIQEAITAATAGDTVFVFDDSSPYEGAVVIDKALSLIGEKKETTVIESNSVNVVTIKANNVTMSGFTVNQLAHANTMSMGIFISKLQSWPPLDKKLDIADVRVEGNIVNGTGINSSGIAGLYLHDCAIFGNTIQHCGWGIDMYLSTRNSFEVNHVADCGWVGINVYNYNSMHFHLWFLSMIFGNNSLNSNYVEHCRTGILLSGTNTENDRITENILVENKLGVCLGDAFKAEIAYNEFDSNNVSASLEIYTLMLYPTNSWHDNYWDAPRDKPMPIRGHFYPMVMIGTNTMGRAIPLGTYPVLAFDRSPAQNPCNQTRFW